MENLQATELRIGNKIYCDDLNIDTGKWHQRIIDVGYRDIYNLINGHDMIKGSYEPIPLTEEWLDKFSIDKEDITMMSIAGGNGFYFVIDNYYKQVYYLHEVQNLYWCLFGEELEVKL